MVPPMSQARMYPSALFLLQQFCPFWWVMVHVYSPISTEEGFNSSPQGLPQKLTKQSLDFREAPFWNVLVLYGHCPNSFRPPPLCQTGKRGEKSAPNHPGRPLHPPSLLRAMSNVHMETKHFKKGASLTHSLISGSVVSNICIIAHFKR